MTSSVRFSYEPQVINMHFTMPHENQGLRICCND